MNVVEAGNWARWRITFPRGSSVALADVTADVVSPDDQTASLTVTQIGQLRFQADFFVPVNAEERTWVVEGNSNAPSTIIRKRARFSVRQP